MLKKIALGFILFLSLFLVVVAFLPSNYHVERSISIEASPSEIYPYIQDFKAWETWSPWAEADPNQTVTVSGEPGKPGHVQAWDGPVNGKGSMTIDSASPNAFVAMNLEFTDPQPMKATSKIELEAKGSQTTVIWHNEGELDYPVGRIFGLFLDSMIGQDFEKGLLKLKTLSEKK